MREIDEVYADSGEPVTEHRGVTRRKALTVGGIGLAGALAAMLPGRAGAVIRRKAQGGACAGQALSQCGPRILVKCQNPSIPVDTSPCYCATIYYGKTRPATAPLGACADRDWYCPSGRSIEFESCVSCDYGQKTCLSTNGLLTQCPPGHFCGIHVKDYCGRCCYDNSFNIPRPLPVCVPFCGTKGNCFFGGCFSHCPD
jgi:hypothetical protein